MELDEAEVGCEMEKMEKKQEQPGLINFFGVGWFQIS
jgi:hypothetical protein